MINVYQVQSSFLPSTQLSAPGADFFHQQLSRDASKYLCHTNSINEMKCCSCTFDCYENCCIDVAWGANWNIPPANNVQMYLLNYIENDKEKTVQGICHPIMPWIDEHKREHYLMTAWYVDHNGHKTDCPFNEWSQLPVYSFKSQRLFVNKNCALLNNVSDYSHLNYSIHCEKSNDFVKEGKTIKIKDMKMLFAKCMVKLRLVEGVQVRPCPNEKSFCHQNNSYYDLCRKYRAPARGYKNKYCYLCDQNTTDENPGLDECSVYSDDAGINFDTLKLENYRYPREFQLIVNNMETHVIKNVKYLFPIKEFIGITDFQVEINRDTFFYERLCSNHGGCCSCDKDCFKKQICCMDILWNETKPVSMMVYRKQMVTMAQKERQYNCEEFLFTGADGTAIASQYFLVISTCLPGVVGHNQHKCLSSANIFSLMVVSEDGNVFKNKYCAQCNLKKYSSNDIQFYLKECSKIKPVDATCANNSPFYDMCHTYYSGFGKYKNMFCYLCQSEWERGENMLNVHESCSTSIITWSVLISFQADIGAELRMPVCHVGEELNEIGLCVQIKCPWGSQLKGSVCEQKSVLNPNLERCLVENGLNLFYRMENRSGLTHMISDDNMTVYDENNVFLTYKINVRNESVDNILSRQSIKNTLMAGSNIYLLTSSNQPLFTSFYPIDFQQNFPDNKLCHKYRLVENNNSSFTTECGLKVNGSLHSWSYLSIWILLQGQDKTEYIAVCDRFYLKSHCLLENVDSNVTMHTDGTMSYRGKNDRDNTYEAEEYIPTKHGIAVCNGNSRDKFWLAVASAEIYITYIGTSLSIIFYIIVFFTFILVQSLQKTPGLCTLALTLSLFVSDFSYILGGILEYTKHNEIFHLCQTVAVLMHFGIVAAYIWCTVIAFDMMVTFSVTLSVRSLRRDTKPFVKYCIISSSLCALIMTCACVLDRLHIVSIGYGKDGICVPHEYLGRLYFYIIPAFISTFCSCVFIGFSLCKIARDNRMRKMKLRRSRRHDLNVLLVGFKLIFILGIPEMIGFIQMKNGGGETDASKWFFKGCALLYTTLRSLRGVMLAIVYICKKDILRIYFQAAQKTLPTTTTTTRRIEQK